MSRVCQCDVCGAVAPYKRCVSVKIWSFNMSGGEANLKHAIDVCPACYAKLSTLLNLEGKKNND